MVEIKKKLSELNIVPNKKLGQNFLFDKVLINDICTKIKKFSLNKPILEIGPGLGILTQKLFTFKKIKLIEVEKKFFLYIKKTIPEVDILLNDCLLVDWDKYMGMNIDYFVYGNLPYSIATKIIFKWIKSAINSNVAMFMIQKEVAEKISATTGTKKYSSLSVLIQYFCDVEFLFNNISPKVFFPEPKVESSVLLLKKNKKYDEKFSVFTKLLFRFKRKTMINNLKDIYNINIVKKVLCELKFNEKSRAEIFNPEEIFTLFCLLTYYSNKNK